MDLRNCAIVGHATTGKTTLSEAMLFTSGEINRLGSVDDGSTTSDYNADEINRKISISTALLHCVWKNSKLNIIDTPGYSDFVGEVHASLRVTDLAVIVLNPLAGVEVGTEAVSKIADKHSTSKLFFLNRLDKENADFEKSLGTTQERFENKVIPIHLPTNPGEDFDSFVDIIKMNLVTYEKNGSGKFSTGDIPDELKPRADELHEKLIEVAAESDDELLEKYFEEGSLSSEEIKKGLRTGIAKQAVYPMLCGSAIQSIGIHHLLDFIEEYCPSPADRLPEVARRPDSNEEVKRECKEDASLSALVFKTVSEAHVGELSFFRVMSGKLSSGTEVMNTSRNVSEKVGQIFLMNGKQRKEVGNINAGDIAATVKLRDTHTGNTLSDKKDPVVLKGIDFPMPVIRIAIEPRAKGDEEKISNGLHTLHEEDPTFVATFDSELRQTIIAGQGELHLDIVVKRLKERFGVEVDLVEPKIPHRETIKGTAQAQGKYKKQSGGRGQYGDAWIKIEPLESGAGFEFVNAIVGGVIPSKFIPAVEKGIRETMEEGVIAGYPVNDIKVTLYDGSYHNVDSSDMAFKIAGSMAFKRAFSEAKPILLEPIYDVEVVVPEDFMGDVIGDLSSRRGKILGMDAEGPFQIIKAKVPLSELYRYSTSLRSLTQGRGIHRRKLSHYEEVPNDIAQKIIASAQEEKNQ
ncbi:elongation factor G [candidate division KSB1 bacterium]|nr:elongation factor G [candidate division KSB1 bacterium]